MLPQTMLLNYLQQMERQEMLMMIEASSQEAARSCKIGPYATKTQKKTQRKIYV